MPVLSSQAIWSHGSVHYKDWWVAYSCHKVGKWFFYLCIQIYHGPCARSYTIKKTNCVVITQRVLWCKDSIIYAMFG